MNPQVLRRFREFRRLGVGGWVGHDAEICLNFARVEYLAEQFGIYVNWSYDVNADAGPVDWGWSDDDCREFWKTSHRCGCACILDDNGDALAYLGGIWDADGSYRRIIEAELLSEAIRLTPLGFRLLTKAA